MSAALDVEAAAQRLGLTTEPEQILADLRAFTDALDRELDAATEGLGLPCKKGCDACCHEAVFLSAPEFLRVLIYLKDNRSASELRAVSKKMLAIAGRYEDEFEMLDVFSKGAERDEVAARVKFSCPLLSDDGMCSVYEAREVNARSFGRTFDGERGHPYGCELTQSRLHVLPQTTTLPDAREIRKRLRQAVAEVGDVKTYPQWFLLVADLVG